VQAERVEYSETLLSTCETPTFTLQRLQSTESSVLALGKEEASASAFRSSRLLPAALQVTAMSRIEHKSSSCCKNAELGFGVVEGSCPAAIVLGRNIPKDSVRW
jgi:hypothetical protein